MLTQHPHAVGTKFDEGGKALRFPGSSIVAHLPANRPQVAALLALQERAQRSIFGNKLVFLPAASLHMTVFDLVCDQVRVSENWSTGLSLQAPLEEADRFMKDRLAALSPWPQPLNMHFAEMGNLDVSLHIQIDPADQSTASGLADFREAVSQTVGIRHPNHERYRFHITLAYRLAAFDENEVQAFQNFSSECNAMLGEELGTFDLPKPELVFFDDMCTFPTERKT